MSDYDVIVIGSGAGGGTLVRRLAPSGQAHPAARARRLAAARAGELGRARRCSSTTATSREDTWYDDAGQAVPAAGPLLRRRRDQALRRRALPPARGGLRRARAPRRHLARLADRLRRDGALLHARRAALPGPRRARRGPDRAAGERALPVPGRQPRAAHPAALRRPRGRRPPSVPRALRRHAERGEHAVQRAACAARPATASPASCTRSPTPRCSRSARRSSTPTSRCSRTPRPCGWRPNARGHGRHRRRGRARRRRARRYAGDIVVVSCGAANSAKLLLASASDAHPAGLANGSDQVGRNYMFHNSQAVLALSKEPNPTVFQKTLGLNDFYFGARDFDFPLGNIQMVGKSPARDVPRREADRRRSSRRSARSTRSPRHAVDFWLSTEDLPRPGQPRHAATATAASRSPTRRPTTSRRSGSTTSSSRCSATSACTTTTCSPRHAYLRTRSRSPASRTRRAPCRFGTDPATSVLDTDCRAHEVDNLYVVDTSFFPSIGAVNPALTAMANALRVGDHIARAASAPRSASGSPRMPDV